MTNVDIHEKLNALMQLQDEEKLTCKMYEKCNACPNLLAGGYCEIKLAISRLNAEVKAFYKEETEKNIKEVSK